VLKKFILTVLCTSAAFAQTPAIDWDQQKAEILRHYRALVQLDTSNPPDQNLRSRSQAGQSRRPVEGQRQ
jgi:hypothetical protein